MTKILQINLRGSRVAQDWAYNTAKNRGANILILSEYYNCNGTDCYSDTDKRALIELVSSLSIQDLGREEPGFRWIKIGGIRIYSCYRGG